MKKIIGTFLVLLCVSSVGYSQFTKGRILAGGSFNLSFNSNKYKNGSTTTSTGKTTSINLYPQVGYFFIDNLAAGAGLSIGSSSNKSGSVKTTSSSFYFSPFVRYYYTKFYGQLMVDFGSTKTKVENSSNTNTSTSGASGWSLAAGYAHMLNEHVALEPQIGYGLNYFDASPGKDISGGLFIRLGFQIYLGK